MHAGGARCSLQRSSGGGDEICCNVLKQTIYVCATGFTDHSRPPLTVLGSATLALSTTENLKCWTVKKKKVPVPTTRPCLLKCLHEIHTKRGGTVCWHADTHYSIYCSSTQRLILNPTNPDPTTFARRFRQKNLAQLPRMPPCCALRQAHGFCRYWTAGGVFARSWSTPKLGRRSLPRLSFVTKSGRISVDTFLKKLLLFRFVSITRSPCCSQTYMNNSGITLTVLSLVHLQAIRPSSAQHKMKGGVGR